MRQIFSQRGLTLASKLRKDVLCINPARHKSRAILFHFAQQSFPPLIDRRHITHVDDV